MRDARRADGDTARCAEKDGGMADAALPLVFDGHNDTLLDLPGRDPGTERDFFVQSERGHIDLPRAKAGGLGGGFFAVFVPGRRSGPVGDVASFASAFNDPATRPLTPELDEATRVAMRMAANLF